MKRAYIHLTSGRVFEGERFGAETDALGEMVFTTAMVGYMEALSDPSYHGQILAQTFPLMGNYGVIPEDMESDRVQVTAYVARQICDAPSNYRAQGALNEFLRAQGVPGVMCVDTRALTRELRAQGVMNALITDAPELNAAQKQSLDSYAVRGAVAAVSDHARRVLAPVGAPLGLRVVLIDYGTKSAIARALCERGCEVISLPFDASAEDALHEKPDGIMLSNGPGDPSELPGCVNTIRDLLGHAPLMGVCLGHQLLALAAGARTEKMKFGHRGANKPVTDLDTGHVYITSQNHGYVVTDVPKDVGRVRFIETDDHTVEGVEYPALRAFSVQFHPEACAGPRDAGVLFDRFVAMMREG